MSEGFFDRWSRRKQQVREGEAVPAEAPPAPGPVDGEARERPAPPADAAPRIAEAEPLPPPTLDEARALTPESDFKPFMARNVAPEVKNTALRKLFADPHFNVMDGLDIYIDDYTRPSPIPLAAMKKMASAHILGLFDEKDPKKDPKDEAGETRPVAPVSAEAPEDGAEPGSPAVAATAATLSPPADAPAHVQASQDSDDHDPDLRLQQDDAAGAGGDRPGTA